MTGNSEWLNTGDTAEALGVTQRTVYRLINEGHLVAHRFGRVIRVRQSEIDAFIARSEIPKGSLGHLARGSSSVDVEDDDQD